MDMFYNTENFLLTNTGIILLTIAFHVNGKRKDVPAFWRYDYCF